MEKPEVPKAGSPIKAKWGELVAKNIKAMDFIAGAGIQFAETDAGKVISTVFNEKPYIVAGINNTGADLLPYSVCRIRRIQEKTSILYDIARPTCPGFTNIGTNWLRVPNGKLGYFLTSGPMIGRINEYNWEGEPIYMPDLPGKFCVSWPGTEFVLCDGGNFLIKAYLSKTDMPWLYNDNLVVVVPCDFGCTLIGGYVNVMTWKLMPAKMIAFKGDFAITNETNGIATIAYG